MSTESFLCQNWQALVGGALALLLTVKVIRLLFPGRRRAPSRPPFPMPKDLKSKRATGKVIECVCPATGEKLGEVNSFTPEEVVAAYKAAKVAAADWSKSSFAERRALLMDILDWVVANQPTIIKWSTEETGKTMTEASLGEVMMTCEKLRWLVAHGEDALLPEDRPVPSILMTKKARVEYYPCGVIGAIVPWNYPVHNVLGAASAALFAGNGFICKVSEISSFYAADLERVMRTIIAKRGYNPELVTLVTGYGDAGAALVRSGVEKVLFIGSPATGKRVMNAASENLTPVILELGGKDPFIVFDDANLNHVLDIALRGAFINQGQNCISAERFYVQAGVYDKFVKLVQSRLSELRAGAHSASNRCDFGSMTMGLQVNIVKDLVKDAVSKGAKLVSGGNPKRWEGPNNKDGKGAKPKSEEKCLFHEPTILADVTHEMKIANEEAFGPVMTIIKFNSEEEVIRLANCTKYGLGCSIFSNYTRAERVGSQMDCGQVSINDFAQVPLIQSLPFGGCKDSGFGHFNGKEGLRGFSRVRSVVTDRFRFPMEAPKFLQYPISPAAYQIVQEGVKMVYGPGWISSAVALVRMLKLIISNKPEVKAKDE